MKKKTEIQEKPVATKVIAQAQVKVPQPPVQQEKPPIIKVEAPKEEVAAQAKSELPAPNRYNYHEISNAPRNGTLIIVSATGADKGEIAFWKRTRAMCNATHRWEETGFFVSNITNAQISFTPRYWRMREINEI